MEISLKIRLTWIFTKYKQINILILTTPIRYGLPASPKACDKSNWKPSAVDLLIGIITY
mgnify:CR=1 FL=1